MSGRRITVSPAPATGNPDHARFTFLNPRATDARCLAIGREDFAALLDQEPRIALAMLPVLARRLVAAMQYTAGASS